MRKVAAVTYIVVGDIMDNKFKLFIVLNSALFAALGNITAANATASRLVYSMARDGHLPKLFARLSGKHKVPMNAMVMISALALAIGIFGVSQASLLTTLVDLDRTVKEAGFAEMAL